MLYCLVPAEEARAKNVDHLCPVSNNQLWQAQVLLLQPTYRYECDFVIEKKRSLTFFFLAYSAKNAAGRIVHDHLSFVALSAEVEMLNSAPAPSTPRKYACALLFPPLSDPAPQVQAPERPARAH